jgi:adenylate kinase family enzyme
MKVINFYGGPGSGKSTTAAGVFHEMKMQGYSVELVTEYAKDVTWEKRFDLLEDQAYVFAKQNRRLARLKNQVEWVVTDSPLPLSLLYMPKDYFKTFEPLAMEIWNSYQNISFIMRRHFEYQTTGRKEDIDAAHRLDSDLDAFFSKYQISPYELHHAPEKSPVQNVIDLIHEHDFGSSV